MGTFFLILYYAPNLPTGKSGDLGYPPEIGICDMIYVGYATPLADANTFLRFILNPRRPEGSPVPMLSTPVEEISDQEAMKL
jgi:hypothetical protein